MLETFRRPQSPTRLIPVADCIACNFDQNFFTASGRPIEPMFEVNLFDIADIE